MAYTSDLRLAFGASCAARHSRMVAPIPCPQRCVSARRATVSRPLSNNRGIRSEDKVLKYSVRCVYFCLLLACLNIAGISGSAGQTPANVPVPSTPADRLPDPRFNSVFAKVDSLIADQELSKAYDAYLAIKKDAESQNAPLAADAMLRASLLGYNVLIGGPVPGFDKLPIEAQDARRDLESDIARKSHDLIKQLIEDPKLGDTQAGRFVLEPHWPNIQKDGELSNLRTAIEGQIDHRNSRKLQYQIVDKLVKITGAQPAFSYWFALILIAILVKSITFPLTLRTYKSQREMQRVQPLIKELQEKYKGKPELNEKMMAFYKEHNINPFSSCFPMLVQLPFMYYVYNTIRLYEYHFSRGKFLWIGSPVSHHFPAYLGTDLARFDMPLLVIYALSNYLTMKLNPSPDPAMAQQQKTQSIMMTVMFFWMFMKYQWSAAFIFYWLILNFISAFQQYNYIYKPNKVKTTPGIVSEPASIPATGSGAATGTSLSAATASRPRPKARKRK